MKALKQIETLFNLEYQKAATMLMTKMSYTSEIDDYWCSDKPGPLERIMLEFEYHHCTTTYSLL